MNLDLGFTSSKTSVASFSLGNGLQFNGTDNFVQLSSSVDLGDFTYNVWLKYESTTRAFMALFGNPSKPADYLIYYPSNGKLSFRSEGYPQLDFIGVNLVVGVSTMITIKRELGQLNLYLNGVFHSSNSIGNNVLVINRLGSFFHYTNNYLWKGLQNELSIWSNPLTDMEINQLYSNGNGSDASVIQANDLELYFKMNGTGSDINILDSSTNGNNGIFGGTASNQWVTY